MVLEAWAIIVVASLAATFTDLLHHRTRHRAMKEHRAASRARTCGRLAPAWSSDSVAFAATFGLVVVFLVIFPVLVQGLIALLSRRRSGSARQWGLRRRHRMPGT